MNREQKVELSSFATECFRNVADEDYILARVNYKLGLVNQFQWCALQAIEKYLKAILLYNQRSTKGLGHDLVRSLERVNSIEEFDLEMEPYEIELIKHLNDNAQNRYLEQHSYTRGKELLHLDGAVWSLRRYCKVINYEIVDTSGNTINILESEIRNIESQYYKDNPHKFIIIGGFLEKVLQRNKSDELRKALVWKNFRYGNRRKKTIRNFTFRSTFNNPPHIRDPDKFEFLSEYIEFPKRVKRLFERRGKQSKP